MKSVALGLGAALILTRFIESLLYRVSPREPFTFVAVIGLIVAFGVRAALLPVRRATRVDPLMAIRQDS